MIYYDGKEFTQPNYNAYILLKHLSKKYGKETALAMLKKNQNKMNEIAKALGKEDITFFCLYFLQDIFVVKDDNEARELSTTHYQVWELLQQTFVEDESDKLNLVLPRGMAKTTIGDLALTIWLVCYQKSKFTLIGAKKDTDAQQFTESIKKVFQENKMIIDNFGNLIDKKNKNNANEIEFSNGMYIRACGSGTSVRGFNFKGVRPSVCIMDDFQSEVNILTEDAREKTYSKWCKEIEKVGDTAVYRNGKKIKNATKIISIGTVLHKDCLISQLSRNKDYYTFLRQAIILKEEQTVDDIFESDSWLKCKSLYFDDKVEDSKAQAKEFYNKNKEEMKFPILWEEKWDLFDDIAISFWENRSAFMSEMQNNADSISEKWFKSNRTQPTIEIESNDFIKTMLTVDPAGIKNKKKGDHFAFVVGSTAKNDFKYIRKGEILHFITFDEYINHIIKILKEFEDITHVAIEKNTYMGLDLDKLKEEINKDDELCRRNFTFINEQTFKNKDEKISTVVDDINNGRIIFDEARVMKEAIEQMMEFQGQKYTGNVGDDFVDCVAELCSRIDKIEIRTKMKFFNRNLLF